MSGFLKEVISPNGERRFLAEDGAWYIDMGVRKDGTTRKPKKCKAGYVPPEEVEAYESKGTKV